MKRTLIFLALSIVTAGVVGTISPAPALAEFPRPSLYPISWELKFEHGLPKRIVVEVPNSSVPQPFWYMTYTVTNNTDKEQTFLPFFELVTRDGKIIRSDNNIPAKVFDLINAREHKPFLQPAVKLAGELRIGDDQAKEGVAIWPEPDPRMGNFNIYVGGLSGENAALKDEAGQPVKDKDGSPIILRKTLQLNYLIRGDEVYPGEDEVNEKAEAWVMR